MWKHLSCPYILKFIGVFYHNDMPVIVTPWVPHGNITEYLEEQPDEDRLPLVNPSAPAMPGTRSLRASSLRSF